MLCRLSLNSHDARGIGCTAKCNLLFIVFGLIYVKLIVQHAVK
jgi:hypothetical protein